MMLTGERLLALEDGEEEAEPGSGRGGHLLQLVGGSAELWEKPMACNSGL